MSTDDTIRRLAAFLAKQNAAALTTTATTLSAEATREADRVAAASEPALGNPADDGYKLASTAAGRRSWVADTALSDPTTTAGDLIYRGASALARLGIGDTGRVLRVVAGLPSWATLAYSDVGAAAASHTHDEATTLTAGFFSAAEKIKLTGIAPNATANTGTVTSVGLSLPNILTVAGSPVTTSGSLTATLTSQTAGTVLAAPAGSAGTPTFRALAATDIPSLAASKITSGVLGAAYGGTGIDNATRTLTINTNAGTLAFSAASSTLTIPATGTAALLGTAQTFSATNTFSAGVNIGTATTASGGTLIASGNVQASVNLVGQAFRLGGAADGTKGQLAAYTGYGTYFDFIESLFFRTIDGSLSTIITLTAAGAIIFPLVHRTPGDDTIRAYATGTIYADINNFLKIK